MWPLIAALLFWQGPDWAADGLKALESGKYDVAADSFRKAIAADPRDYFAHFNLALAYSLLHKNAESVAEYRKTLEIQPRLYEAELNAGIVLLGEKDAAAALPLLEDAAAQKPGEYRPVYYLAEAELAGGDAAKAEESFRRALALKEKSAGAELGMAHALARQGRLADAAPHFEKAAQLDPAYREGLLELAGLFEKERQPGEALAIYRQFPENASARERAGALMLANSEYAAAIPHLEAAYAGQATQANRVALGVAYQMSGDAVKAAPLLEAAAAAEPNNFEVRMAFGRALRDQRKYPAAAAQFYAAAQLKSGDRAAWDDLAVALYLAGDYTRALAAFEKARQLGDESAGNCFLRAIILDKLKQMKPALAAYEQFLALSRGQNPDQEWQARQRSKLLRRELDKR